MRYVAPYGQPDADAPYYNGDVTLGRQGSIPPAEAFENHQRELVNYVLKTGLTPSDTDEFQLMKSARAQRVVYVADSGAANTLSVAMDPVLDGYTLGQPFQVRILHDNTGPASFDAGPGRHPIKRSTGTDLAAADLKAGMVAKLVWDGINFQLVNSGLGLGPILGGPGGTTTYFNIKLPYVADISGAANSIVAPFSPAITSLTAGDLILVLIANRTTSTTQIFVNGLASAAVKGPGGNDLFGGSLLAGQIAVLVWTGTYWMALNSIARIHETIYSTYGTYSYTVPVGCYEVEVELWGAGASGYNSPIGPTGQTPGGTDGPGGASGGYSRKRFAVVPGTVYSLTVGRGGLAVATNADNPGGTTSFDVVMSATGGVQYTVAPFHRGGVGVGGDENIRGGVGHVDTVNTGIQGYNGAYGVGAAAPRGGGTAGPYASGHWPGGAGGGGDFYGPAGSLPSGAGADGGIKIRWWA
jgi:hypothetical protein